MKKKTTWGDWWFRGAAAITIVWFGFLVTLVVYRFADYWPLFTPKVTLGQDSGVTPGGESSAQLSLNEIGDFLAGSFAPLAFIWFFVSTWLQREELKETREVLADQQAELRRAAQESAEQTGIMQRQLEQARSRDVYEEHRLRLHYLAQFIITGRHLRFIYRLNNTDQTRALM
jgi:hypothetical protein